MTSTESRHVLWLGPAPAEEAHPEDDPRTAFRCCRLYQVAVRLVLGDEPPGAVLRVLTAPPDREHPFELALEDDPREPAALAYVERCRPSAPTTWAAAGISAPDPERAAGRG